MLRCRIYRHFRPISLPISMCHGSPRSKTISAYLRRCCYKVGRGGVRKLNGQTRGGEMCTRCFHEYIIPPRAHCDKSLTTRMAHPAKLLERCVRLDSSS